MIRLARGLLTSAVLVVGSILAAPLAAGQHATPTASPMASPAPMSGTAAAFMTITNSGAEADRLLGGSTDVAQVVEVHEMAQDNGMMRMQPLPEGLEIPAGGEVLLESGGLHLMLIGLTRDLVPGSSYALTLEFEQAGEVEIDVAVQPAAPSGAGEAVTTGALTIANAFSRPAPMLGADMPTHGGMGATPAATPGS
jgi:copper(I)-binding protein